MCVGCVCSLGILLGRRFEVLVVLRALQSAAVLSALAGYMTWFTEFLPTRNR